MSFDAVNACTSSGAGALRALQGTVSHSESHVGLQPVCPSSANPHLILGQLP